MQQRLCMESKKNRKLLDSWESELPIRTDLRGLGAILAVNPISAGWVRARPRYAAEPPAWARENAR